MSLIVEISPHYARRKQTKKDIFYALNHFDVKFKMIFCVICVKLSNEILWYEK